MKVYYCCVYVGNYEINALADDPAKCVDLLAQEYVQEFGSFKSNGFKSRAEWLDFHGISADCVDEIEINSAWTR